VIDIFSVCHQERPICTAFQRWIAADSRSDWCFFNASPPQTPLQVLHSATPSACSVFSSVSVIGRRFYGGADGLTTFASDCCKRQVVPRSASRHAVVSSAGTTHAVLRSRYSSYHCIITSVYSGAATCRPAGRCVGRHWLFLAGCCLKVLKPSLSFITFRFVYVNSFL